MTRRLLVLASTLLALATPPLAHAGTPPPNDDRANAAPVPAFPATMPGTTVDATLERLDPQISQCGRIESTVWYSVEQAPDGTIQLGVQAAGLAPVIRVYRRGGSGITEVGCASAAVGERAQVSFESVRGAGFLVIVGKKPSTADSAFSLDAQLFLPPANDSARNAEAVAKLPASVKGSTLGATTDQTDPKVCSLYSGTVWYSLSPGSIQRFVLRLHTDGDLDATIVVRRRIRSEVESVACARTDRKGNGIVAVDVEKGAQYLVAVGQRKGSPPGDFTLDALAAQAAESAPGRQLPHGSVSSTVNGLTDVNDVYWTDLRPGTTYRIAFNSQGCATLELRRLAQRTPYLRELSCSGYTTFTPGPDGGGRYVLEINAPRTTASAPYRVQIAAAAVDDLGVGVELPNLRTAAGTLSPGGIDVVDVYHFDVAQSSDVRLRLKGAAGFSLQLVTDRGAHVLSASDQIRRRLAPGRYVVAVRGTIGGAAGRYALSLVIRQLTSTSLTISAAQIGPGSSVTLSASATPAPDGGAITVQIDRFDPLTGWQFSRLVRLSAPGGSLSWAPPAEGRWRARASFLGTLRFSPSRSGYVTVLVQKPGG